MPYFYWLAITQSKYPMTKLIFTFKCKKNVFFVESDKQVVDLKFSYSENRMTLITDLSNETSFYK